MSGEQKTTSQQLLEAAEKGDLNVIQQLLTANPKLNLDTCDADGWTPLMYACTYEHIEVVDFLLKKGANPNTTLKNGWTALHSAAFSENEHLVRLLIVSKANIAAKDEFGKTPIQVVGTNPLSSSGSQNSIKAMLSNPSVAMLSQPSLLQQNPTQMPSIQQGFQQFQISQQSTHSQQQNKMSFGSQSQQHSNQNNENWSSFGNFSTTQNNQSQIQPQQFQQPQIQPQQFQQPQMQPQQLQQPNDNWSSFGNFSTIQNNQSNDGFDFMTMLTPKQPPTQSFEKSNLKIDVDKFEKMTSNKTLVPFEIESKAQQNLQTFMKGPQKAPSLADLSIAKQQQNANETNLMEDFLPGVQTMTTTKPLVVQTKSVIEIPSGLIENAVESSKQQAPLYQPQLQSQSLKQQASDPGSNAIPPNDQTKQLKFANKIEMPASPSWKVSIVGVEKKDATLSSYANYHILASV